MRYQLVSFEESSADDHNAFVTVDCKPNWLEMLMGLHQQCVAFYRAGDQWQGLDGDPVLPSERRILEQLWCGYQNQNFFRKESTDAFSQS